MAPRCQGRRCCALHNRRMRMRVRKAVESAVEHSLLMIMGAIIALIWANTAPEGNSGVSEERPRSRCCCSSVVSYYTTPLTTFSLVALYR